MNFLYLLIYIYLYNDIPDRASIYLLACNREYINIYTHDAFNIEWDPYAD